MELPPLPPEFSAHARNNIIVAEIKAARAVTEPGNFSFSSRIIDEPKTWLVFRYIMSVFSAFAHEACELGRKPNGWSADKIDRESRGFLLSITIRVHRKYDAKEFHLRQLTDGSILRRPKTLLKSSMSGRSIKTNCWK